MRKAMLVIHTPNEIVTTALFLFQIAMLKASMRLVRDNSETWKSTMTYMRSTINSEAMTKAR